MTVGLSASRTYPLDPETAFAVLVPLPLPDLFRRAYGPIAAIRRTDETPLPWGREVGQQRGFQLVGPGSMTETLTLLEPPTAFGYELSGIRGPLRLLASAVEGRWDLEPVGTGTRVTWSWQVTPTALGRPLMPAFGYFWRGYARQALEELEHHLLRED